MTDGAQPHLLLFQGSESNTILSFFFQSCTLIEFSSMFFLLHIQCNTVAIVFFWILQKALVAGWETPSLCIEWVEWS